jgi:hypothetical protein
VGASGIVAREAQDHEPIWLFDRQTAQKRLIEQRVNRRVRADAQRQGKHGNYCERRRFPQQPQCVSQIFNYASH